MNGFDVMSGKMTVMTLFYEGGWVMWGLLALSIVGVAVAIERMLFLRRSRLDAETFVGDLRKAIVDDRSIREAQSLSRRSRGPVARVAAAALRRFERSPLQLEQIMERQAGRELRLLHRRLGVLATIATTAPLLGFLGTVTGMMISFEHLATQGLTNPGAVALGIKAALTTTAAGLTVAVPIQIAHNALLGRVERITGDIEAVGNVLLEIREEMG